MMNSIVRSAKNTGGLMPTDPPWSRQTQLDTRTGGRGRQQPTSQLKT